MFNPDLPKLNFNVIHWHWTCGDGCCSDSGYRVECECAATCRQYYYVEVGSMNSGGVCDGWMVYEAVSRCVDEFKLAINGTDMRAKAFEIAGKLDRDLPWNWTSFLGGFDQAKIKALFAYIGFDVNVNVEDERENEDNGED